MASRRRIGGWKNDPVPVKQARATSDTLTRPPKPPDGMGDIAVAYWRKTTQTLVDARKLKESHLEAVEAMCRQWETYQTLCQWETENPDKWVQTYESGYQVEHPCLRMKERALRTLKQLWNKFGMTPEGTKKTVQTVMDLKDHDTMSVAEFAALKPVRAFEQMNGISQPLKLSISCFEFVVCPTPAKRMRGRYGEMCMDNLRIRVSEKISPQHQIECLLHECEHAILATTHFPVDEEPLIRATNPVRLDMMTRPENEWLLNAVNAYAHQRRP